MRWSLGLIWFVVIVSCYAGDNSLKSSRTIQLSNSPIAELELGVIEQKGRRIALQVGGKLIPLIPGDAAEVIGVLDFQGDSKEIPIKPQVMKGVLDLRSYKQPVLLLIVSGENKETLACVQLQQSVKLICNAQLRQKPAASVPGAPPAGGNSFETVQARLEKGESDWLDIVLVQHAMGSPNEMPGPPLTIRYRYEKGVYIKTQ